MSYVGSAAGLGAFLVHALLAHVAQEGGHRGLVVEAVEPELPVEADGQVDGDRLLPASSVPSCRPIGCLMVVYEATPALWSRSGSSNSIHCWRLSEFDPAFVLCRLCLMISVLVCSEEYTDC